MQETEIKINLNHDLLSFPSYVIETENNSEISREAVYISARLQYLRRVDLEGQDSNLVIIDLIGHQGLRIINVYRSFTPQPKIL